MKNLPKKLENTYELERRYNMLDDPHIAPLTNFVHQLRESKGIDASIPYFDPLDGGVNAEVLFLLEAPGPKARNSGFVSRDNPDETAKNMFEILMEAGIERTRVILWNVVPWYIGDGKKIRPAKMTDIYDGTSSLNKLLTLLPNVRCVVLVGKKAQKAKRLIRQIRPDLSIFESYHPSPLFVNNKKGNRDKLLYSFLKVKEFMM